MTDLATDGGRDVADPEIYDVVEAPPGHECQRWRRSGDGMVPCDNAADVLFVFERNMNPDSDARGNCLACADCGPTEPTVDDVEPRFRHARIVETLRDDPRNDKPAGTQWVSFGRFTDPNYHVLDAETEGIRLITHDVVADIEAPRPLTEDAFCEYIEAEYLPLDESEERLATDGGTDGGHWCDICDRGFETVAELIGHDCSTVVADGGAAWTDLTAFQRDILVTLAREGPSKGTTINDALDADYAGEIHHGRLYTNLDTLVAKSLVSKSARDKRTNEYALTPSARAILRAQQERWAELDLRSTRLADGGVR